MRTLTLGVLIVTGGTLAALPFRRYQSIRDASSGPVQTTGPTESALGSSKLEMLVDLNASEARRDASPVDILAMELSAGAASTPPPNRHVSIPLTYEDLAVPIDHPDAIAQRFNAAVGLNPTVDAHQVPLQDEQSAGLVMPRLESLTLSQQDEIQSLVSVIDARNTTVQADTGVIPRSATLASASSRERNIQRFPASESSPREKHWIRQPE